MKYRHTDDTDQTPACRQTGINTDFILLRRIMDLEYCLYWSY